MIGIYKITSPSYRIYIGQSIDISKRFSGYNKLNNCKSQIKLYNSFLKYGVNNHIFEIIKECDINELNKYERYYQDFFNVIDNGLNLKLQSTFDKKQIHSEEVKNKISKSLKGKYKGKNNPMFGKVGILNLFYGKKHTKETISKIKEKNKGRFEGSLNYFYGKNFTKENNSFYGKKHTKESLNKMSNNHHKRKDILDTSTGIFYYNLNDLVSVLNMSKSKISKIILTKKRYIYA